MITEILTDRQEALRAGARALLDELAAVLERLGDGAERTVRAAADELEDLFLLSFAGAHGPAADALSGALVGEPPPRHLSVSPAISPGDARRADLALFLTSAHRPLAPPEHPLLQAAARSAEHLLVAVDEAEMLRLSEDLARMEEAVEVAAERILGRRPLVQMVSTARIGGDGPSRESLVPALARRVVTVLRSPEVLRPKLLRPLGTALEVARERRAVVEEGLAALAEDLANLEVLERELAGFHERAEAALREAQDETDREVAAFGERVGGVVRRGTRPFPPLRRHRERLEREGVAGLPDRLQEVAARLEERIAGAARAARSAVEERVTSFPTEGVRSSRESGPGEAAHLAAPGTGRASAEVERSWHPGRDREISRPLAESLRRTSAVAFVLLAVGLAFAAAAVVSAFGGGTGWLSVALGGGLGGASVLAALAVLKSGRRRLTGELSRHVEEIRSAATAALAAGAERVVEDGRDAVRAPVARYAETVAAERERLTGARESLESLEGRLEDLRRRVAQTADDASAAHRG